MSRMVQHGMMQNKKNNLCFVQNVKTLEWNLEAIREGDRNA